MPLLDPVLPFLQSLSSVSSTLSLCSIATLDLGLLTIVPNLCTDHHCTLIPLALPLSPPNHVQSLIVTINL